MAGAERYQTINRVYGVSLAVNIVMLALKMGIGLLTGSLAMVADAVDSLVDSVANVIAMVMTRIAGRPADETHPYGHRRFETLAALMVGGLLLLTGWEIVQSSIARLVSGEVPEVGLANFAVMGVALAVNLALFFYQRRTGERVRSEVLMASAEDKRNDIFVSLTVLASLVAVDLGWGWIDAVTALAVVIMIGRTAWTVLSRAAGILVDRVALNPEEVRAVALGVPGVYEVTRVRSRGPEDDVHLDIDVRVAAPTTADRSAAIAQEVRAQLRDRFEGLNDIQVNFLPARTVPPDYALMARAHADALGLGVHEVIAAQVDDGLMMEMHVEVSSDQTVSEAHEVVSQFEARLEESVPELLRIVTHIEPAHLVEQCQQNDARAQNLSRQAVSIATQIYPYPWYDVHVRPEQDGGYALSMRCRVAGDTPIAEAHRIAEKIETQIRAELPLLHRVTIHTEPNGSTLV